MDFFVRPLFVGMWPFPCGIHGLRARYQKMNDSESSNSQRLILDTLIEQQTLRILYIVPQNGQFCFDFKSIAI